VRLETLGEGDHAHRILTGYRRNGRAGYALSEHLDQIENGEPAAMKLTATRESGRRAAERQAVSEPSYRSVTRG
jgi:hypothetical protein